MEIVFGTQLDGLAFPETTTGEAAAFNSAVVGFQAFLGLLELKLGINCPQANRTIRLANYLRLIKALPDKHFFSASLSTDAWAAADYLLAMRDELVCAGWDKKPISGLDRIISLAKIEESAQIDDGYGERHVRVNQRLQEANLSLIKTLKLAQPISIFPSMWQKTIALLERLGTEVIELPVQAKSNDRGSDIFALQQCMLSPDHSKRLQLKGDGTVAVLDAADELAAATFVAAWMAQRSLPAKDIVLIRGADCSLLSQACRRYGLPSIGNAARSQLKEALQILPLSFKLACRPLDPVNIVEFLRIQEGPLPEWVSKKLLDAIGNAPGLNGESWNKAWRDCLDKQRSWLLKDDPFLSRDTATFIAKEKIEQHKVWFHECVPAGTDFIAKAEATEICQRVEQWAQDKQKRTNDPTIYVICAGQARLLKQLFLQEPEEQTPMAQVYKMVEAVLSYGSSVSGAEAADWALVDKPGQIWDKAPVVVWWSFAQTDRSVPRRSVWSEFEIEQLRQHGVILETLAERLKRERFCWTMPLLNAANQLILIKPRVVAGERAVAHPIWDELVCTLDGHSIKKISSKSSELFSQSGLNFARSEIECVESQAIPLPAPLRTWQVPAGKIKAKNRESFSSIDRLLGCGLAWVLRYSGSMYEPKSLAMPQKQQLIGVLAHAIVNEMYKANKQWHVHEARKYAARRVNELIPEMAATLLLPGARPQLREATEAIPKSIEQLVEFLNHSGAEVEDTEIPLAAKINETTILKSTLDMLLRLPSGTRAVLDLKWSSSPYFYRKRLVEGTAIQLAIYSWLAQESDEQSKQSNIVPLFKNLQQPLPPAGYFMLRQGDLYFTSDGVFPRFTLIRKMERDLDETWKLTLEAYQRELAQLQSGKIIAAGIINHDEITLEDFVHPVLSEPPCNFCEFSHFCGLTELT